MEREYYKNVPYLQYQILRLFRIIRHYFFRGIVAWDHQGNGHKTPEAKNAYNSRIRKFLMYLEMKEAISMGMHLALPGQAAGGEKIVEILSQRGYLILKSGGVNKIL